MSIIIALSPTTQVFCWVPDVALAYSGGERGIRTLDASFETYMISNHAPSTAQTPLQKSKCTARISIAFRSGTPNQEYFA